ncbi:CDP-alcohol phosphatidyltransferase family protein [Bdellovibrionota bacterium FG-1]
MLEFKGHSVYHWIAMTLSQFHGMSWDLWFAVTLLSLTGLVAALYMLRSLFWGKARFDRIDRQGGSALLSKGAMQGGYWFFQPLGRALLFFHVTPNQVSWSSLFFGFIAGVCLGLGHFGSAACFGALSAILDALDGMVARLTGMSSEAGEVLDASVDRYVEFFMFVGLMVYYREIPVLMLLAAAAMIGAFMVSYSTAKAEALHVDPPKGSMRRPERAVYLLLGAVLSPMTITWFERTREFVVPIAHPMVVALGVIAVLANVSAVERFMAVAKAVRAREVALAAARKRAAATVLEEAHHEDGHHHEPVTR